MGTIAGYRRRKRRFRFQGIAYDSDDERSFHAQPYMMCIVAGLILIGIGVVGSIKTYIDPGKFGRIAALGIGAMLLIVGFTLYARQPAQAAQPQKPTVSSICTFDTGPQAGLTSQLPETALAPVGSSCQDTAGNKGTIVAPDTPLTAASKAGANGSAQDEGAQRTSHVCTFNKGRLAGKTQKLHHDNHLRQAIGEPCHDLDGNSGFIVAENTPLTP
jgi:hypothetical protein